MDEYIFISLYKCVEKETDAYLAKYRIYTSKCVAGSQGQVICFVHYKQDMNTDNDINVYIYLQITTTNDVLKNPPNTRPAVLTF